MPQLSNEFAENVVQILRRNDSNSASTTSVILKRFNVTVFGNGVRQVSLQIYNGQLLANRKLMSSIEYVCFGFP